MPKSDPISGEVDHTGVAVRSIDSALEIWYSLGFRVVLDRTLEQEGVRAVMLGGRSRIELLEGVGEENAIKDYIARRGEGIHHVAVRVAGLEDAIEEGKKAGLATVGEIRSGIDGRRIIFFHPRSAGGILIELVEGDVSRET